jgi:succinoglycan biosynthesis protein ExoM
MLRRCLEAVCKLTQPEGADISIIVVDNEPGPNNRAIVEEFGFLYRHEPRRGIASARNAALEAALSLEPDFIAFTDDDCQPSEDWLCGMRDAQRRHNADVVSGRVAYTYPDPLPSWILKRPAIAGTGRETLFDAPTHVSTNNVMFSAHLVRSDGLGLRFDTRFNFTSGEDADFFVRAFEQGASIVEIDKAIVLEEVTPERCTYWGQVRRQYQHATADTTIDLDRSRHLKVIAGAIGCILNASRSYIAAVTLGAFSVRRFKKHALRGGKKLMYAAGQISVLAGYRHEGYRVIDGQ